MSSGLTCRCGCNESSVIDSRPRDDGTIRRRRQCHQCDFRFSTTEAMVMTIEERQLREVKRNTIVSEVTQAIDKVFDIE